MTSDAEVSLSSMHKLASAPAHALKVGDVVEQRV